MPIIEAMAAIVTGDHCLLQAARKLSVENIMNNNNNNNGNKNLNVIDSQEDDF